MQNPLVTSGPQVRFYAGAPLAKPDGLGLGSLCVMDTRPRRVDRREKEMLQSLARMVMTTMELNRVSDALASEVVKVKNLAGLLPICSGCKNIRNDGGYWQRVESFVQENSSAEFTHGMCPKCAEKYFPDLPPDELAEALICKWLGVTQEAVDDFDMAFKGEGEPGDAPDCPYRIPHRVASAVEYILALALDVDWKRYEERLEAL